MKILRRSRDVADLQIVLSTRLQKSFEPRLMNLLPNCERPVYAGRAASASPATGSYTTHELEQTKLVGEALALKIEPETVATEQVPKMGTDG